MVFSKNLNLKKFQTRLSSENNTKEEKPQLKKIVNINK